MSPRRWGELTRLFVYAYLCERDSERCSKCGKRPATLYNGALSGIEPPASLNESLEIDHRNGDKHDNRFENLRLLCKGCNLAMRNKIQPTQRSARNRLEREILPDSTATRVVRQILNFDDTDAPITIRLNSRYEIPFGDWLLQKLREHEFLPKKSVINGGAQAVGCSPLSSRRYLEKLCDLFGPGPVMEVKDALGISMITWRPGFRPKGTEDTVQINLDEFQDEPKALKNYMQKEKDV